MPKHQANQQVKSAATSAARRATVRTILTAASRRPSHAITGNVMALAFARSVGLIA